MTPFEAWLREYMMRYGEAPDLSEASDYDYAKALAWGIQPRRQADGQYHWPSTLPNGERLKKSGHPTWWKQGYTGLLGSEPEGLPQELLIYRALGGLLE